VAGIRVLALAFAGRDLAVGLPATIRVEPEDFDLTGRAIDERDFGLGSGCAAGASGDARCLSRPIFRLRGLILQLGQRVRRQIAPPVFVSGSKINRALDGIEFQLVNLQSISLSIGNTSVFERRCKLLVIKCPFTIALLGIDQDELPLSVSQVVAIPEF
jgi:hypothetical protein